MILHYFKKKENTEKVIAKNTYERILQISNSALLKNNFFKEKNYQTSFEIVSIIIIFTIKLNIMNKVNNYKHINEELINIFVSDLDESLRIKGIGDMSIGKYVKSYVKKFYFRLSKFPSDLDNADPQIFIKYLNNFDFIRENQQNIASKIFLEIYKNISVNFK